MLAPLPNSRQASWIDSEDGETISQEWASTGCNGLDKGFGSALTYGERYYLLKLFHIQTDTDDVDAIAKVRDKDMEEGQKHEVKEEPLNIPENVLGQWVAALAKRSVNKKTGQNAEEAFKEHFNPTEGQIKFVNRLVDLYRKNNNIK